MTNLTELICTNAPTEAIKANLDENKHNANYVNLVDKYRINALMFACMRGNIEALKLLLQYNADVNFANEDGYTALMCACSSSYTEIVKLLLEANADVNTVDKYGRSALKIAELYERTEAIELLNNFKKDRK